MGIHIGKCVHTGNKYIVSACTKYVHEKWYCEILDLLSILFVYLLYISDNVIALLSLLWNIPEDKVDN